MKDNIYLNRYAYPHDLLEESQFLGELIVVIPSYNEETAELSVQSLADNLFDKGEVLVIVVVNESEDENTEVRKTNDSAEKKLRELVVPTWMDLQVLRVTLPMKKAGVGLARKIGMDQAVRIFEKSGVDGIIICFDADCTCQPDYLKAIYDHYETRVSNAATVFYEHPLDSDEIILYELFLRYYVDALRWAGFPWAYQTLGSCITVKSSVYQKQGGMNQRKAGEDFYFLQKVIPLGNFHEINSTTVYPSSRISDRVPFGTGHAVGKIRHSKDFLFYNPEIFQLLKDFLENFFAIPSNNTSTDDYEHLRHFLEEIHFEREIEKLKRNSSSDTSFRKQFFQWFDGFKVLKFVHYFRDHQYPSVTANEALDWLHEVFPEIGKTQDLKSGLQLLRDWDRKYWEEH